MLKGTQHLPLEVLAGQLQSYQFLSETLWQLDARRSMIGFRSVIPDASTIDDITGNCDDFRRLGPLIEHGPHPYRGSWGHQPAAAGQSQSAEAATENGLQQQAGLHW